METTKEAKQILDTLPEAKRKEWRKWGNEAYKGRASMMRGNSHHPDYDTREKREAIHDANEAGTGESAYNFTPEGRAKLASRFGYSERAIDEAKQAFLAGYSASRAYYKREDAKHQAVLDKYAPIFAKASEIAHAVDVSDIQDGFPCGWAHVYLDYADRHTALGEALAHFNDGHSHEYKYQIEIKMPTYGQCIAYGERVCGEVVKYLRANGVMANVKSTID